MKNTTSLSGKIIHLTYGDTRYGPRAEARLEHIDWSTGEVTAHVVVAWGDVAHEIAEIDLGGELGVSGFWRKKSADGVRRFTAKSANRLRHIDPRQVDVSAYL